MAKVNMQTELKVPADEVWEMIGGYNALPDWHPAVVSSELESDGKIRRLKLLGGGEIVERLERIDEKERLYRYSIIHSPFPVVNYTATIRVRDKDDGAGSVVEWSSEFDPENAPETDAVKTIQDVYQQGFDNLRKMFGS